MTNIISTKKITEEQKLAIGEAVMQHRLSFIQSGRVLCERPLNTEKFMDKRFYRYVDKLGKLLESNLTDATCEDFKCDIYYIGIYNCTVALSKNILPEIYERHSEKWTVDHLMDSPVYNILFNTNKWEELTNNAKIFIKATLETDDIAPGILNIAKNAFIQTVLMFLMPHYIMKSEDKFSLSYTSILPDETDMNFMLYYYQTILLSSLELWLIDQTYNLKIDSHEKAFNEIKDKIKIVLNENDKLKKKLLEKQDREKDFLPTLIRLQKEAAEGTEEQKKMYNEHLKAKDREISKLEKQIQQLQNKIDKLTNSSDNKIAKSSKQIEDKKKECDTTLPYMFAMCEWSTQFEQQLLDMFPNATIIYSSSDFNTNTNLVIFLTSHIKHNMYYKVKSMCKNANIPILHFASSNLELLKQEIAKTLD